MKKLLLIVGILLIVACVLSLAYAALSRYGYYHVLDGSAELYQRLHRRMILFSASGLGLAVLSAVCLILRTKQP